MVLRLLEPSWAHTGTGVVASGARSQGSHKEESRMEGQYMDLKPLQNPNSMGEDDIK